MLDRFAYGNVCRISPEAPVPVLSMSDQRVMLGGAGNVVRNLLSLGVGVHFVSLVGEDAEGDIVRDLLTGHERLRFELVNESHRKTTVKTRFVAGHQQVLRVDSESRHAIGETAERCALVWARNLAETCDVIVLSDYGKGFLSEPLISGVIETGKKLGRAVVVDPKGSDYLRYRGASLLTPNLKELSEATQMPIEGDEAVVACARQLISRCGLKALLATRSADGMSLVEAEGAVSHLSAQAREVFDVSGAGDTVVAMLAAALSAGASFCDAARLANLAAGIAVGKVGTAVVYPQEVLDALHRERQLGAKVVEIEAAQDYVEIWKRQGYRVGFANGIFDLLHPGHINLLSKAALTCDRLVVGLNGDDSVRSLRGGEGPCQDETARSMVLASLEAVDLVVVFREETPLELLRRLRPDVLIKGSNYLPTEVVGAALVRGYGGDVVLVDIPASQVPEAKFVRLRCETI